MSSFTDLIVSNPFHGVPAFRFRGATKLEPSDRVLLEKDGNDYTLVIKGVALKEAGIYTVKAFADLGTESADAMLTVKGMRAFNFYSVLYSIRIMPGITDFFF